MKESKRIKDKVKRSFEEFDNLEEIRTSPFFEEKLFLKIEKVNAPKQRNYIYSLFRRLQPAFYTILILMNVLTFIYMFSGNKSSESMNEVLTNEIYIDNYYTDIIE